MLKIQRLLRATSSLLLAVSTHTLALGASPNDASFRQDLQALTDTNHLHALTLTWPIAWSELQRALATIDTAELPPYLAAAHTRLSHITAQNTTPVRFKARISSSTSPLLAATFGPQNSEIGSLTTEASITTPRFASNLSLQAVSDNLDAQTYRLDNSFVMQRFGNWGVGIDTVDRWWGPGWHSSLILSHNARPIPKIFVSRQTQAPFETPWLNWLGPWHLETFMGQLESDRFVPDTLIWGIRLTLSPHPRWEIGLTRTALWSGEGRPSNFDVFTDLLFGRDNIEPDDPNKINEPGDQLGGIDLRYAQPLGQGSIAVYTQVIGEDEAGNLPSRPLLLAGISLTTPSTYGPLTTVIEYHDSALDAYSHTIFNSAYNHSIYQTGYRYRGRAIGTSFDNDTQVISWGGLFSSSEQWQWSLWLSHINGNRDGVAGNNTVFQSALKTEHAEISATYRAQQHKLVLSADWWDKLPDNLLERTDELGFRIDYSWQWGL